MHKILSGQYRLGSRLPSCRDLAAELGINRNTAHRIYQQLAQEGFIRVVPGEGFIVVGGKGEGVETTAGVRELMLSAGREAKLLGLGREAFLQAALDVANALYQRQHPAIAFVECNQQDAELSAREVEQKIELSVQPLVLSALQSQPEVVAADFDLICTNLYHLSDVKRALGDSDSRIVAVHSPPDADVLLEIAHLDQDKRLGIVCSQPSTTQVVVGAVRMVHQGAVLACLVADVAEVLEIGRSVDVVIDTPTSRGEVERLLPGVPSITMHFRLDKESLGPLRERLANLLNHEMLGIA